MLESNLCILESILDKYESTLDRFNFSFASDSNDDSFSENKLIFTILALLLILLQNNIEEESLLSLSVFCEELFNLLSANMLLELLFFVIFTLRYPIGLKLKLLFLKNFEFSLNDNLLSLVLK